MSWITDTFPGMTPENHRRTSDPTDVYNCIAWAANVDTEWWSNLPGYYWPVKRSHLIESLVAVFVQLGYEDCGMDGSLDPTYSKVALYARNGMWKHAARQKLDGKWESKLGPDEDIEHDTPESACGKLYGKIHCFMRKTRT